MTTDKAKQAYAKALEEDGWAPKEIRYPQCIKFDCTSMPSEKFHMFSNALTRIEGHLLKKFGIEDKLYDVEYNKSTDTLFVGLRTTEPSPDTKGMHVQTT
eukprot:TRINITY_DN11018_c0_g1_i1.p1 TRINITY_DN11018_c0_g1~~TRINITY_DN11018_c0_g1_i1.p1  ORF type:complete len:114 (-),score=2.10 TRINITY_DN11018_c0_g1_i1:413-712(-)